MCQFYVEIDDVNLTDILAVADTAEWDKQTKGLDQVFYFLSVK